jgi:heme-degrading monooxygenase HmoA
MVERSGTRPGLPHTHAVKGNILAALAAAMSWFLASNVVPRSASIVVIPMAFTSEPPYWAVIFTSERTPEDPEGYAQTAGEMVALASKQPGFLGVETARGADGVGITVSYWESLEAIQEWRRHADHQAAQKLGRERWYLAYTLRVARVERAYGFER